MPPKEVTLGIPFNEEEARAHLEPGANTIRANALVRQQGGGVVTCAGAEANLIPATGYARARFGSLYGNTLRGYRSGDSTPIKFEPDLVAYRNLMRTTKCDAQGNFVFEQVAEGDFYVMTVVAWSAGYSRQGGWLMQLVSTRGGKSPTVVLSP